MKIEVRAYEEKDLPAMIQIWNEVVEEGIAFPQEELLTLHTGKQFFASQTYNAVAICTDTRKICGLYILHPNNVGRCGHICNASYAVHSQYRGLHVGEQLVTNYSDFKYCSLMPLSLPMFTHAIYTNGLDFHSLERFQKAFA